MLSEHRRTLAGLAIVTALVAACGSGEDGDSVVGGAAADADAELVSSEARWINTEVALDEFDISVQKTDPTVLGAEVVWDFAVDDLDVSPMEASLSPDLRAGVSIDDQGVDGSAQLRSGRAISDFEREIGQLRLLPTADGFRIDFLIGTLLGASDLQSQDEFEEFLEEAGVDAESAPIRYVFIEDAGTDGVLNYRINLSGTVDVGATTVAVDEEFEFTAVESDPDAVAVARDESALAEAEVADAVESGDCVPLLVTADDSSFTIAADDDSVVVEGALPAGWGVELQQGDVCDRTGLEVVVDPEDRRSADFAVLVFPAVGEDARAFAERRAADSNIDLDADFDADSPGATLAPGDEGYTTTVFEETELAGKPAVRSVGTSLLEPGSDTTLTFVEIVTTVADQAVVVIYSFLGDDDTSEAEALPMLLDELTITP